MVQVGDTVKAWKRVMDREYSTEGAVEAVQVDQLGDQLAKITSCLGESDWYKMVNDLENKFEVLSVATPQFIAGQRVQLTDDPTIVGTVTQVMRGDFLTVFWDGEYEGDYVLVDQLRPLTTLATNPTVQSPTAPLNQYPDWQKMNRQEQNAILKKHNYRWVKYTQDDLDDNDEFDREPGWYLFAPDGREVDVERAFNEINRGVEAVRVEIETRRQVEKANQERRRQIKIGIQTVAEYIRVNGEKPENPEWPQGDILLDSRNIYGSGEAFVVEQNNTVWYLIKNGMDGDDWSRNNLPGHIAFKLSAAPTMAEALRQLAAGEPLQGGLL